MSRTDWKHFLLAALLGAALLSPGLLNAADSTATNRSKANLRRVAQNTATAKSPETPPVPVVKSPVYFFRELLAMNTTERQAALTNRSPESRTVIMAKLREYAALDADERELRLQATDLRWYLWPLMNTPATNRFVQLTNIPAGPRVLVESRLKEWDSLAPEVRKELLENEAARKYFTEIQYLTPERQKQLIAAMKPEQRANLQAGIDKWSRLDEGQRQSLGDRFNQFFALTEKERQRALGTLSDQERRQIEKTLQTFGRLPAPERAECIRSFEKFADLSLVQRQMFLKNAERWRNMTPNERQAWRQVVSKVPSASSPGNVPPLPPEFPPLPLANQAQPGNKPIATNGN